MPRGIRQPGSGRPRLSEDEKRARGTFTGAKEAWVERRREANLEAQREAAARRAEEADPVPPPDDDLDDFEKGWWRRLAERVDEAGTFRERDHEAFRLLVLSFSDAERYRTEKGVRPSLSALTGARRAVSTMLQRFGIDPSSRGDARTAVPVTDEVAGLSDPSYRLRLVRK